MPIPRKSYPRDVGDDEWAFCVPYVTFMNEAAPQREYPLRELFNGLRWFVRAGCPWRRMPNDLPPWHAVHNRRNAGSVRAAWKVSRRICGPGCAWRRRATATPPR